MPDIKKIHDAQMRLQNKMCCFFTVWQAQEKAPLDIRQCRAALPQTADINNLTTEVCNFTLKNNGINKFTADTHWPLEAAIASAAPNGVDIIFENVGGDILDAGLSSLNEYARVVLCGLISEYNTDPKGARNLWQLIVKQAAIKGFLIRDYVPQFAEGAEQMAKWIASGELKFEEHIEKGIENTFEAFMLLFSGGNQGKLILDISP